jgi:hypothetical protein
MAIRQAQIDRPRDAPHTRHAQARNEGGPRHPDRRFDVREETEAAAVYEYELDFHNQLNARVTDTGQVVQVMEEVTLDPPTEKAKAQSRIGRPSPGICRPPASKRSGGRTLASERHRCGNDQIGARAR